MKTMKVNPLKSGKGIFIRWSENNKTEEQISRQSFNWWLNHEIATIKKWGYQIIYSDQKYDADTKKFI
jgi:hypothetical protein